MRQLTLDIRPPAPPSFGSFVPGENAQLLVSLHEAAAAGGPGQSIYLYGPEGSGRSHLLQATVAAAQEQERQALYLSATSLPADFALQPGMLLALDDLDALPAEAGDTLFRAFLAVPRVDATLVLAGQEPPVRLGLRPDLRTRVGAAQVFEVKPLSDEEKVETLHRRAALLGMPLGDEVVQYLLRHENRELSYLLSVVDALDALSLELKRPVTVPLLREILIWGPKEPVA